MLTLEKTRLSWKGILRQNITKWEVLADFLHLNDSQKSQILKLTRFPLNLPLRLANKIQKGTLCDPILHQFLPRIEETEERLGFSKDPVGHNDCRKEAKLVHKYQNRALITCTSACAMHCRYCYRRHFPYDCSDKSFEKEMDYVERDPTIQEVIVSGGDPLSLDDRILRILIERIKGISHVKRLRFHSRFPIGIPERIDSDFLSLFEDFSKSLWFVIHCNHPRELDDDVLYHLSLLKKAGFNLLNQSVLLKGVNDDVETLQRLCETLINYDVLPYYLHQLDRVEGAAHFEVSEDVGKKLMKELTLRLPGYAVPKYVREISGEPYKAPL